MKKIIEVDENTVSVMQVLNNGDILTILSKELPTYEEPKDEVPSLYPEDGTDCWIVTDYGTIYKSIFCLGENYVTAAVDTNSAFFTKEEAEFELNRRKVITKLKLFAEKNAKWDGEIPHHYLSYNFIIKKIIIVVTRYTTSFGTIYFESQEQAQKAIDLAGEENVKKYYLGVIE